MLLKFFKYLYIYLKKNYRIEYAKKKIFFSEEINYFPEWLINYISCSSAFFGVILGFLYPFSVFFVERSYLYILLCINICVILTRQRNLYLYKKSRRLFHDEFIINTIFDNISIIFLGCSFLFLGNLFEVIAIIVFFLIHHKISRLDFFKIKYIFFLLVNIFLYQIGKVTFFELLFCVLAILFSYLLFLIILKVLKKRILFFVSVQIRTTFRRVLKNNKQYFIPFLSIYVVPIWYIIEYFLKKTINFTEEEKFIFVLLLYLIFLYLAVKKLIILELRTFYMCMEKYTINFFTPKLKLINYLIKAIFFGVYFAVMNLIILMSITSQLSLSDICNWLSIHISFFIVANSAKELNTKIFSKVNEKLNDVQKYVTFNDVIVLFGLFTAIISFFILKTIKISNTIEVLQILQYVGYLSFVLVIITLITLSLYFYRYKEER